MAASLDCLTPKTLLFCPVCRRVTPHEIREVTGVAATACVPCINRALCYELDRE